MSKVKRVVLGEGVLSLTGKEEDETNDVLIGFWRYSKRVPLAGAAKLYKRGQIIRLVAEFTEPKRKRKGTT